MARTLLEHSADVRATASVGSLQNRGVGLCVPKEAVNMLENPLSHRVGWGSPGLNVAQARALELEVLPRNYKHSLGNRIFPGSLVNGQRWGSILLPLGVGDGTRCL